VSIRIVEPLQSQPSPLAHDSLADKGKGKGKLGCQLSISELLSAANPIAHPPLSKMEHAGKEASPSSLPKPTVVLPFQDLTSTPLAAPSPTSMLSAFEVFSSPAVTPDDIDCMAHDGPKAFFLELADLDEPVASTDSSKKRKLEEGEEFSSVFFP